jgi:hypothetical protein
MRDQRPVAMSKANAAVSHESASPPPAKTIDPFEPSVGANIPLFHAATAREIDPPPPGWGPCQTSARVFDEMMRASPDGIESMLLRAFVALVVLVVVPDNVVVPGCAPDGPGCSADELPVPEVEVEPCQLIVMDADPSAAAEVVATTE